eukprot:2320651-Amphidinium_carterae.1
MATFGDMFGTKPGGYTHEAQPNTNGALPTVRNIKFLPSIGTKNCTTATGQKFPRTKREKNS